MSLPPFKNYFAIREHCFTRYCNGRTDAYRNTEAVSTQHRKMAPEYYVFAILVFYDYNIHAFQHTIRTSYIKNTFYPFVFL